MEKTFKDFVSQFENNCRRTDLSSDQIEWQLKGVYELQTKVLHNDSFDSNEKSDYYRKLSVAGKLFLLSLTKVKERESLEDQVRLKNGMEPKSMTVDRMENMMLALKKIESKSDKEEWTKLAFLLQAYYQQGRKPLNKTHIESIAKQNKLSKKTLRNRWIELEKDNYTYKQPEVNTANLNEFKKSYLLLMAVFQGSNERAFKDVESDYNSLNRKHPS
jgi:hypothetical protein